ncbi:MAG: hypothetical protein IJ218_04130 [Alphaproteobacteria bacterium]|nr:hypothetical protein [Alphaproteobacteria bacterium]
MRFSRTATGLLARQYSSVLKKCFWLDLGLLTFSGLAIAAETVTDYDGLVSRLATDNTANVVLDMSGAGINMSGDGFEISSGQTVSLNNIGTAGKIMIKSFNVAGGISFADITDENFKLRLLETPSDKLQLALSTETIAQLGPERVIKTDNAYDISTDSIEANNTWNKEYHKQITGQITYGKIDVATSATANDSIGMKTTSTADTTIDTPLGDTLRLVAADTTNLNKTFNATASEPNYTVSGEGDIEVNNNLSISGLGKNTSTLNINEGNGFVINENSALSLNNLTLLNGSDNIVSRNPSPYLLHNLGTLAIDNVLFNQNYVSFLQDGYIGAISNEGHITQISNTDFTDLYITITPPKGGPMGGIITNKEQGIIDVIKDVTVKNLTFAPQRNAPHGGFIENAPGAHIGTLENITLENITMLTHEAESATDSTGGGGNHGVIDNQGGSSIDYIKNITFKNNYLYRPGTYDITGVYENNHASAPGLYNQGAIKELTHALFEDNHTKTEMVKASSSGALLNLSAGTNTETDNQRGRIDKMTDVRFIHNYIESAGRATGAALSSGVNKGNYTYAFTPYIGEMTNVIFQRNFAHSTGSYAYGGALNNSGTIGNIIGEFTQNYALSDDNYALAGAIQNKGALSAGIYAQIGDITANFIENYAKGYLQSYGGAILNYGKIGAIEGNFETNYAQSATGYSLGGAIYNNGHYLTANPEIEENGNISSVTGDFSGNYAKGYTNARGGAIYNTQTIGAITAANSGFKENYAQSETTYAYGGAIYNFGGTIDTITADFSDNSAVGYTQARGGAIYTSGNTSASINTISGKFSNNTITALGAVSGGAIYNRTNSTIEKISGSFISNLASSTATASNPESGIAPTAGGGAIFNAGYIKEIEANFTDNSTETVLGDALGGAIYQFYGNETSQGIDLLSGTFSGNTTKTADSNGTARGGAIYNGENMSLTIKDSAFSDNYALVNNSNPDNVQGGAIYNVGTITFVGTNTFTNNSVRYNSSISPNTPQMVVVTDGIHNLGTITVDANGVLNINDGISGTGTITLGNNAKINLNNKFVGNQLSLNNSSVIFGTYGSSLHGSLNAAAINTTAAGGTLDTTDGYIADSELGTVNLAGNLNYLFDLNLANKTSDILKATTVATDSAGKIMIKSFNVAGSTSFAYITDENFKLRLLETPSDKLQLALSAEAVAQLGGERVIKTTYNSSTQDSIKSNTLWSDIYYIHGSSTAIYGKIDIATSVTTNDSIGMKATRTADTPIDIQLGDTLRLVAADTTNLNKTFNATASAPNYTVSGEGDIQVNNNLSISGLGKNSSVLSIGASRFSSGTGNLSFNNLTVVSDYLVFGINTNISATAADLNGTIHVDVNAIDNANINLTNSSLHGDILFHNFTDAATLNLNLNNADIYGDIEFLDNGTLPLQDSDKFKLDISGKSNLSGVVYGIADANVHDAEISLLPNSFSSVNVVASDTVFKLSNDAIETYSFKQLNDLTGTNKNLYDIDIDLGERTADKISIIEDSAAVINLNRLNITNANSDKLLDDEKSAEFTIKILETTNDNVQLKLSENATAQIASETYTVGHKTHTRDDVIPASARWSDIFYHKTQDEIFYGKLELATTQTQNDSIGLRVTGSRLDNIEIHDSLGDTLNLLNTNTNFTDKTFTADTALSTYTAATDTGTTSGTLNIIGFADAENKSTLDFAGNKGFTIAENSAVNVKNTRLYSSGDTSAISIAKDGTLLLENSATDNIDLAISGTLDIATSHINVKNATFGTDSVLALKIKTLDDHGLFAAETVSFADTAKLKVTFSNGLIGINQSADIQILETQNGNFAALNGDIDNNLYRFIKKNDDGWYTIYSTKTARDLVAENGGSQTVQEAAAAWVDSRVPYHFA